MVGCITRRCITPLPLPWLRYAARGFREDSTGSGDTEDFIERALVRGASRFVARPVFAFAFCWELHEPYRCVVFCSSEG